MAQKSPDFPSVKQPEETPWLWDSRYECYDLHCLLHFNEKSLKESQWPLPQKEKATQTLNTVKYCLHGNY